MIGPRRDRAWWDQSSAVPPSRPPQLRTVLLIALIGWAALGLVSVVAAHALAWWRSVT